MAIAEAVTHGFIKPWSVAPGASAWSAAGASSARPSSPGARVSSSTSLDERAAMFARPITPRRSNQLAPGRPRATARRQGHRLMRCAPAARAKLVRLRCPVTTASDGWSTTTRETRNG